jgi:hypothetical protein
MRRHIPDLHLKVQDGADRLEGLFLVRVEWAFYRWSSAETVHRNPIRCLGAQILAARSFSGRLYCTERALWKLNWFLRDFGYDPDLLGQDQVDEKALRNLRGVIRTSYTTLNGRCFQNLEAFAPAGEWEELSCAAVREKPKPENADDL